MPRQNPEDINLAAIKTDLEFLIERVEPFRREQARKSLYTMVGSAAMSLPGLNYLAALPLTQQVFGASRQSPRYRHRHRLHCHPLSPKTCTKPAIPIEPTEPQGSTLSDTRVGFPNHLVH